MKRQNEYLKIADEHFKSEKVKRIIRLISDSIYLNSYGKYTKVPFKDLLWLLRQKDVDYKGYKIISYILTVSLWRNRYKIYKKIQI